MSIDPSFNRPTLAFLGTAFFVCAAIGCAKQEGPPLGTVSGYVRAEGAPVSGVLVIFEPEAGRASVGRTNESGWYELRYTSIRKGAELGHHTVRIEDAENMNEGGESLRIPSQFNSKSTLAADVVKGSNKVDFDIQVSKKAKKEIPVGEG